jgi:hypothetical protein
MKQEIIEWTVSAAISATLIMGNESAQQFAYYVCLIFNVLGWLTFWTATNKETAQKLTSALYIRIPMTGLQVCALVFSGSPLLAASVTVCSLFIIALAFGALKK